MIFYCPNCVVTERSERPATGDFPATDNVELSDGETKLRFSVPHGSIPKTELGERISVTGRLIMRSGTSKSGKPFAFLQLEDVKVDAAKKN